MPARHLPGLCVPSQLVYKPKYPNNSEYRTNSKHIRTKFIDQEAELHLNKLLSEFIRIYQNVQSEASAVGQAVEAGQ